MRQLPPSLPPGQPDPILVRRLIFVQRGWLAAVGLIAIATLAATLFPSLAARLPAAATQMSIPMALTALLCALSLMFSEPGHPQPLLRISRHIALIATLLAIAVLLESALHISPDLDSLLDAGQTASSAGSLPLHPATAFAFMGVVMLFLRTAGPVLRHVVDVMVSCLCLLIMILVSENLFGALGLFGLSAAAAISPLILSCLVLLASVVVLRQAEQGVFSIFLGSGIGSRIARGFAPILLVLPFLSEVGRIQAVLAKLIPAQYAAAILTSLVAAFSIVLLLFLVWRINDMERDIHDLTLRDELTGLYNMRGFYLLAEQTLRLSQRAKLPFAVLFLDLDGLKQINDRHGHNMGSAYLAETGKLLFTSFREGDVKGRFGGDEFVVAGQFSMVGIEIAVQRLLEAAAERNAKANREPPLSFSIGYVTSEHYSQETLKELVTRADEAMYREKRRKKLART
jgi:diguanylate cyclase (GGDEF)-like protein